jgi:hypothetical protein
MNRVANGERHLAGEFFGLLKLQDIAAIRIFLDVNGAKVTLNECADGSLKLCDMLIGPFDL